MEELIQLLYLKRSNIILTLGVFVFFAFSLIGVTHAISDKKISSSFTTYSVQKGQNLNLVIEDLADSEFQKFFLKIYAYLYNFEEIKFGNYDLQNKAFSELIQDLNSGNVIVKSFALIEGMTVFDIKKLFNSLDLVNNCFNLECLKKINLCIFYGKELEQDMENGPLSIRINACSLPLPDSIRRIWLDRYCLVK